jgi:glucokinase
MRGGIDLGGTKIQTVVIDDAHEVRGQSRHPTPQQGGPSAIADQMAEALKDAARQAGVDPGDLAGVGVGAPGEVDQVSDVRVGAQAEVTLGAGRDFHTLIAVWWGTGVGGAIFFGDRPWTGRDAAGEIGHTCIQHLGGRRCPCGRRGCVEAYAGRNAMEGEARKRHHDGQKADLFKLMKKHDKDRLTSGIWKRALDHDDELAGSLLDEAVDALGAGIASAINLLDLEAVIIGGGVGSKLGDPFVQRISDAMSPHLFIEDHRPTVCLAALGDLGGAIGASLLIDV